MRVGYVHMAFLGPESQWAAQASECAGEQGAFWPYHDLLFSKQQGENQGAFAKDKLKGFATELGLNTQAFNACLDSGKYDQKISDETTFAQNLGVRSTPSFLLNGTPVQGALPYEQFKPLIEAARQK